MPLFYVAVLVGLASLDLLPRHSVMPQQGLVAYRELACLTGVVHGCGHAVGAMLQRYSAQFPERILQALAQALEALGIAQRSRFPVRVRQHEVIQQVGKRLPPNRDPQLGHVREIGLAEAAWYMPLGKEHFLLRAFCGAPLLQPPLQSPHLTVRKLARILPLQSLEQGLRLQPWIRYHLLPQFLPNAGKWVRTCSPGPVQADLARQPA